MPAISPLVSAAMSLRAISPTAWEELLTALRGWQADQMELMVKAPADMLANSQGKAQAAAALVKTLTDAPQTVAQHSRSTNVRGSDPFAGRPPF